MTKGKDTKDIGKDTKERKDTKVTFYKAIDVTKDTGDSKDTNGNKDAEKGKDMNKRYKVMKSKYTKENKGTIGRNPIIRPTYVGVLRSG